jgi:hypothetical protein
MSLTKYLISVACPEKGKLIANPTARGSSCPLRAAGYSSSSLVGTSLAARRRSLATRRGLSTSWTAVLDAVRLGPDDDEAEVTAAQVRDVVTRLITAGHWSKGDPAILVIFDAGYDPMRLACRLADLPVEVLGRLRSDRVLHFPVPARPPGTQGRPRKYGREFALADPATWPQPPVATTTATTRYGTAAARPGTGCTPGSPTAPPGWATTAGCPSSKGP